MTNEQLKEKINSWVTGVEFPENKQYLEAIVPSDSLKKLANLLKNTPETNFDYLYCLSGVDYGKQIGIVYHIESTTLNHSIVLKVKTDNLENPTFDTVCGIWKGAEWFEREVFDLLGVKFNNHPDLRRLFLPEDWEGYPLRKNYKDEINIIER